MNDRPNEHLSLFANSSDFPTGLNSEVKADHNLVPLLVSSSVMIASFS